MVVAHVLTSLHVGGGERLTLDLATGQAAAGHRILVVSLEQPADGPLGATFGQRGLAVERLTKRPGFDPTLILRLALLFRPRGGGRAPPQSPAADLRRARRAARGRAGGVDPTWPPIGRPARALAAARGGTPAACLGGGITGNRRAGTTARDLTRRSDLRDRKRDHFSRFEATPERRRAMRAALGIPEHAWVMGSVAGSRPRRLIRSWSAPRRRCWAPTCGW